MIEEGNKVKTLRREFSTKVTKQLPIALALISYCK
jgi:hypothetical protein